MKRAAILLALLGFPAVLLAQDQTLVPTGTAASTNNACTTGDAHTTTDEGVTGGGDWCVASTCGANPTNATDWRFTLDTPTFDPATGTNEQTFAATVRSCASGGTDATCSLDLYCGGSLVETGAAQTVTSATGMDITETFTFGGSCAADGSDAEVAVTCTSTGGTPSLRRTVDLDAVEWRVTWAGAATVRARRTITIGAEQ